MSAAIKTFVAAAAILGAIGGLVQPVLACELPFNLQNGSVADASQLMGNYNAMVFCLQELEPQGADNSIQYKSETGQLAGTGPLGDGQLLTGISGAAPVASALIAGSGIKIINGPGRTKIALTTTGLSGSLYSQILSPTPTSSGTGLTNWFNQGSAVLTESQVGSSLGAPTSGASQNISGRFMPAPQPPYSITALVASTFNSTAKASTGIGWYDGSGKLHLVSYVTDNGNPPYFEIQKWTNATSLSGVDFASAKNAFSQPVWLQLTDDGTSISFGFSQDGFTYNKLYSTVKSSGWLGASGYNNLIFFINPNGGPAIGTLMSWRVD
jgi:hypothetical protein